MLEALEVVKRARALLMGTLDKDLGFWSAPTNAERRKPVYGSFRELNDLLAKHGGTK